MRIEMRADKEKRIMHKKVPAYFTVEAAMIFPVVLGAILLVIYLLFFQYNRCLQEQDAGALALKGCSIQTTDKEALMRELDEYANSIDRSKYLAWNWELENLVLEGATVRVEECGSLSFPFGGFGLLGEDDVWEAKSIYENRRISPTDFLRLCRSVEEMSEEEGGME